MHKKSPAWLQGFLMYGMVLSIHFLNLNTLVLLATLFQSLGLRIDKFFGSYRLEDFSRGKSLRQIIIATKI